MKKHLVFYERFNIRENIIPKNWLKNKQGTYFLKTEIFMVRLPAPPPLGQHGAEKNNECLFFEAPLYNTGEFSYLLFSLIFLKYKS